MSPQAAFKLVAFFKSLGVHYVFDTTFSRDSYTSSKVRDLQCILDDIRTRCVALETNLGTILDHRVS